MANDYSGSAFTAARSSNGLGVTTRTYKVALPDNRTQTVTYTTNDVNGYVAVSYAHAAPLLRAVAHPVAG